MKGEGSEFTVKNVDMFWLQLSLTFHIYKPNFMRWLEEEIKGLCDWLSKANDVRFTGKCGLHHYFMCTN